LEEIRAKRSNRCKKINWLLDSSIGHDPLIYIGEMVLSQQKTFIFLVFYEFGAVQIGIQMARSE
jgi:hypothetical protein